MASDGAAEERTAIRVGVFEIIGERPGIGDPSLAVDQNRHAALPRRRNRVLFSEAPGDGLGRQLLMSEGQTNAPAVRAEASLGIGAGKIVEAKSHGPILELARRSAPVRRHAAACRSEKRSSVFYLLWWFRPFEQRKSRHARGERTH